jgi:uncharacterized secreted protein with C-terminal beta-propeller domain
MHRAIAVPVVLALLSLAACQAEKPDEDVREDSAARSLQGCGELDKQIKDQALRDMNARIDQLIAQLDAPGGGDVVFAVPGVSPSAAPAPAPEGRDSATDFTTTNTQEAGVDEPDFVKNDGSRIFVLHDRSLVTTVAWPPESARVESTFTIEGQPSQMLLYKSTVVVFSAVSLPQLGGVNDGGPYPAATIYPGYAPSNAVKVTVLDVSGTVPRVTYEQYLEGRFLNARRTDSSVRVVTVAPPRGPELRYWPDEDVNWSSKAAARGALERLRSKNAKTIKAASLDAWLPRVFEPAGQGLQQVPRDCASFFATNVPASFAFTTVSTLDLTDLARDHTTILNAADEVYASADALYLSARHYWFSVPSETQVREDHTYLFKFDIASDKRRVRYVASGGVPGHIVDSVAMDEEDGFLRVATTRQTWLGWRLQASTNNVFVLRSTGTELTRIAEISGLARDERIYSARFEGPRGYLVTFRQVDPLFTLDLSVPTSPRVAGELKVPGFSTYLHPIDRDHLLTMGRDTTGAQLQIFDVSNFASPTLQHRYVLGTASSSSEAESEHKAFTYFASRGLLAIPFTDYTAARSFRFSSTLQVLRATAAAGIIPLGSIDHGDLLQGTSSRGYFGWTPQIRRSVMMDDYVYSISYGGLKVHDTRNLSTPIATLVF